MDPPLLSVRATGIPRASALAITETVPLSSVLPVMLVGIVCVWATYCSVTQIHKPAPAASPVHESASEVTASPAEPPKVLVSTAEPPEVAASTSELSDCPVAAK